MIKYFSLIALVFLVGCKDIFKKRGDDTPPAAPQVIQPSSPSCTTIQTKTGAVISCPDGTTSTISNGSSGSNGSQGQTGQKGDTGAAGANGKSLVSTAVAATLDQCPYGGNVLLIAQDTAENGVWAPSNADQTSILICNGAPGPQGPAGPVSTPVSTVKFCSGYTTSYPGTFPEYGLCINNVILGVYWDGRNAWLAEVPPGRYTSTSTSAPCDFTVKPNCGIAH